MNNYNKVGYSVPEVAQILGCTPLTVRRYIYDGRLKADVTRMEKKNIIRIRREHLVAYMKEHQSRFNSDLLKQFGITDTDDDKNDTKEPNGDSVDFAPGAYAIKDVSELKGAWGKNKKPDTKAKSVKSEKRFPAYDLIADGKVVISGCEKLTVGKIVDALITDRQLDIKEISIKKI